MGSGKAVAPTPPPLPNRDTAADTADRNVTGRRRRGFTSTILGGAKQPTEAESLKTLLGS